MNAKSIPTPLSAGERTPFSPADYYTGYATAARHVLLEPIPKDQAPITGESYRKGYSDCQRRLASLQGAQQMRMARKALRDAEQRRTEVV